MKLIVFSSHTSESELNFRKIVEFDEQEEYDKQGKRGFAEDFRPQGYETLFFTLNSPELEIGTSLKY